MPDAHERVVVQVLLDRPQPVVAGQPAADLHAQHRGLEVELVVHDHEVLGRRRRTGARAARPPDPSRSCRWSAPRARAACRRRAPRRRARAPCSCAAGRRAGARAARPLPRRRCASSPRTPRRDCRARPRAGRPGCRCARLNATRAAARCALVYSEEPESSAARRRLRRPRPRLGALFAFLGRDFALALGETTRHRDHGDELFGVVGDVDARGQLHVADAELVAELERASRRARSRSGAGRADPRR